MIKKVLWFGVFCFALISCKSPTYSDTETTNINAVWVYNLESDDNDTLLDKIQNLGLNTAFVSISPIYLASRHQITYQNKVKDFLLKAEEKNILIYALICEQNRYTYTENHYLALEEVENLLIFLNDYPQLKLEGIQMDIEPHTLDKWEDAEDFENGIRNEILTEWLELHSKISEKMSNSNLKISTVITWWYDSKFRDGDLPSGDTNLLTKFVDFIVVMAFSGALPPYEQAQDECDIIKTVVATNSELYNSYTSLVTVRNEISQKLTHNTNYLGQSMFYLDIIPR